MQENRFRTEFDAAIKFIQTNDRFLLTTHIGSDGDGVGAIVGIAGLLKKLGKSFEIVVPDPIEEKLSFINAIRKFKTYDENMSDSSFDSAIIVDVPHLERIGPVSKLLSKNSGILNIDHHISNEMYGTCNLVLPDYAAAAHLVTDMLAIMNIIPDRESASALYTGISADTGHFRFDNTKPETLRAAASLVAAGANPELIARKLYYSTDKETLFGLGTMLVNIEVYNSGTVGISHLGYGLFSSDIGQKIDTDGFVNYILSIVGIEVAFLFKELEKGKWRVSLRSLGKIDVNRIASKFGGGGHAKASGATLEGSFSEVKEKLLAEAIEAISGNTSS